MASNSKTGDRRGVKFVTREYLYKWDTFDLLVFKVILGSFCAPVSNRPITRKRLAVEQTGVKFGFRGWVVLTLGTFDLFVLKVTLRSFGALVLSQCGRQVKNGWRRAK